MKNPAVAYALDWWKKRHEGPDGYFPKMEQHLNWRIYEEPPPGFLDMAQPRKDDDVLEVGCGYGQWMVPCARFVRSIRGIDIHQTLVDRSLISFAEVPNARMTLSDGLTIPFPDKHFSLVYSISVFQHMPRAIVQGYISEICRVMEDSGRALLHFRHADNDGPYSEDITDNHSGDWSVGWSVDEANAAFAAAGLKTTQFHTGGHSLLCLVVKA